MHAPFADCLDEGPISAGELFVETSRRLVASSSRHKRIPSSPRCTVLLSAVLALAGAVYAVEPSCTTAVCVFYDPTATPAITAYPTTLTFTSHDTVLTSSYNFAAPGGGSSDATSSDGGTTTDIQNMVTIEAHAAQPTVFPATVVQRAVTSHTFVHGPASSLQTSLSVESAQSTWIVRPPQPTDLPRHATGLCGNCTQPATWTPDASCTAKNQTTGCVRQCAQRDGLWYCFQEDDWYAENVMGRVCWWLNPFYGTTEYRMLGTPCVQGDRKVDCLACETYG